MKRLFSIFALCASAAGLRAQGNMDLELWATSGTPAPSVWTTFNTFVDLGNADSASVLRTTTAYSGQYAARIRPVLLDLFGFEVWLPGELYQQYASSAKPKSFRFAYKYQTTIPSEPATAMVSFYKGSPADTGTLIGEALILLNPSSNYTYMAKDITWTSANTPDTAVINFSSGPNDTASWLTIDAVSMSNLSAGTSDISATPLQFFQTANGALRLEGKESWMQHVNLFDAMGRLVASLPAKELMRLPSGVNPGIYYFEIAGRDTRVTGKMLLE